jgi:uncharacterized membrane protein YqjE
MCCDLRALVAEDRRAKLARRLHSRDSMQESASGSAPTAPPSFGELVEHTLHDAKGLLQAELSLARRELSSEVSSALGSIGLFLAGAMFLQAALTTLGVFVLIVFGAGAVGASMIAVLAGIGIWLCVRAKHALAQRKLPRTTARLALDAEQVMGAVK